MIDRIRNQIDNRHNIRNPYGQNPNDLPIWVNTLLKERVATLFKTMGGLPGHAKQIECELNRLVPPKGVILSGNQMDQVIKSAKFIKQSILKAKEATRHELHWQCHDSF